MGVDNYYYTMRYQIGICSILCHCAAMPSRPTGDRYGVHKRESGSWAFIIPLMDRPFAFSSFQQNASGCACRHGWPVVSSASTP